MKNVIILDHLASRWDRSPKTLESDIGRSAKVAHVISLTEVADGKRVKALPLEGWALRQDRTPWQAGEVAVLVNKEFGEVLDWQTAEIGPDLGPGNAVFAIVVIIKIHSSGKILLVADAHMPASVEGAWAGRRAMEYRKAITRYKRLVRKMRRRWAPDAEVVWADWNLNLKLPWVRTWFNKKWRNFTLISKAKMPKAGTHGPRLIDWPLVRGLKRVTLKVLAQTAGSDHRGVRLKARIK